MDCCKANTCSADAIHHGAPKPVRITEGCGLFVLLKNGGFGEKSREKRTPDEPERRLLTISDDGRFRKRALPRTRKDYSDSGQDTA